MRYKVFLIAIVSRKCHAPTLSKRHWYEFQNGKPIRNRIIDPIWKDKTWQDMT